MSLLKAFRVGHFVVMGLANRVAVIRLSSYNVLPNESSFTKNGFNLIALCGERIKYVFPIRQHGNGNTLRFTWPGRWSEPTNSIIKPRKVHIWVVCNYWPFIQMRFGNGRTILMKGSHFGVAAQNGEDTLHARIGMGNPIQGYLSLR